MSRSAAAISGYASEGQFSAVQSESQHLRKMLAEDVPEIQTSLMRVISSSRDMFLENKRLNTEIEKLKKNKNQPAAPGSRQSPTLKISQPAPQELESSRESDDDISLSQALDELDNNNSNNNNGDACNKDPK